MTGHMSSGTQWSGLETAGMIEAKCSLLLQDDGIFEPKVKALPKQRVLVYQDRSYNPAAGGQGEENFYVDFNGCTILQLEPAPGSAHRAMPVTLTIGGRCVFTPENYQDFRVMMRTREQSQEMNIAPNGNFDWPDVSSLLMCPLCGNSAEIPDEEDEYENEYWMVFYPLLQITVLKGSQMTLGTRTICRLTCLECMEDLLEGMTLKVKPASKEGRRPRLSFTLPASEVLAEAGSASFLEDGPPRPETHPHVDDILDAWTLYNLWEHSGAWEALQNDYRIMLSRSMHSDGAPDPNEGMTENIVEPKLKDRLGKKCANPRCPNVHGMRSATGDIIRLSIKCKECRQVHYCSRACREDNWEEHQSSCRRYSNQRDPVQDKKPAKVQCDVCKTRLPYTKMKKCSRCRNATYCSVECQKQDWAYHKAFCKKRNKS